MKPQGNGAYRTPQQRHGGLRRTRNKLELKDQDGLTGYRKTQGNCVVEIGYRMSRIEVAGDICLRRPRSTQGCRADDDDDDDDNDTNVTSTVLTTR